MSDGAWRVVPARNPSPMTLDGTRTAVVGRRRAAVVDPGPADREHVGRLLAALDGHPPVAILLTHHHPDHAGAAPLLAAATGAPVLMAAGALDIGFPAVEADRWIAEGATVQTDVGVLRAVATPGHAPEHLAFLWERDDGAGVLFVGDLLMGAGDTSLVAPPEGDLGAYLRSLERVRALAPAVLVPAHGPPLDDPASAVARYLHHREGRIAQVVEALRHHGPMSPAAMVREIYGSDLDPRLHAAAEGSLLAMLRYLEEQGRAGRTDGERYALA